MSELFKLKSIHSIGENFCYIILSVSHLKVKLNSRIQMLMQNKHQEPVGKNPRKETTFRGDILSNDKDSLEK